MSDYLFNYPAVYKSSKLQLEQTFSRFHYIVLMIKPLFLFDTILFCSIYSFIEENRSQKTHREEPVILQRHIIPEVTGVDAQRHGRRKQSCW